MNTNSKTFLTISTVLVFAFLLLSVFKNNIKIASINSSLISWHTPELKEAIVKTFTQGEPSILQGHISKEVTVDILEDFEEYNPKETELQLHHFFKNHPPKNFKIKHEGNNQSGRGFYLIGIYTDSLHNQFRTIIGTEDDLINDIEIKIDRAIL